MVNLDMDTALPEDVRSAMADDGQPLHGDHDTHFLSLTRICQTKMTDDLTKDSDSGTSTYDFIMGLFGLFVLEGGQFSVLPTSVVIGVLELVGVSETAVRVTLTRMVHRGILNRQRDGRITFFALTDNGTALLKQGRERAFRSHPFGTGTDGWTLLNAVPPASPPSRRYHFQQRLLWAGFGAIDTRLWIAPGYVDVAARFGDMLSSEELASLCAMQGVFLPVTDVMALIRKAWDVGPIRSLHQAFLAEWESYPPG